jgi:hypothetical protein
MIVTVDFRSRSSRHPRSLTKNYIGDAGAMHLAEALAQNSTLQKLG